MKRFEYQYCAGDPTPIAGSDIPDRLNEMGNEGWELVSVVRDVGARWCTYFFKRPLIDDKNKSE